MGKVWAVAAALFLLGAPTAEAATVKVTVSAPKGVPATVKVGTQTLAKAPSARSRTFRVKSGKVKAPAFAFDGALYVATVTRDRVTYKAAPAAKRLRAETIEPTRVTLNWTAPKGATVQVRRTTGETPAKTLKQGVRTGRVDRGLKPQTKYSYALFTKLRGGWSPPLTILVSTASSDPAVPAYVAPPSTVIVKPGAPDKATPIAGGVRVQLAASRPAPLVGAGFVLPVSAALPGGFLGKVRSVSADGRTVELVPAGLADAFDSYKLSVDLATGGPFKAVAKAKAGQLGSLVACPAFSGSRSVVLHPIMTPSGHFDTEVVKKWIVPVGAKFDLSAQMQVGLSADIEVTAALECGLEFHVIKPIVLEPVPISIDFEAQAKASIGGELTTSGLGYTVTGGFWTRGEFGLHNEIDGGLIREAGPTSVTTALAFPQVGMSLGGDLTVGPGLGVSEVGVIAGVGGNFTPIEGTFGPVFNLTDRRACIRTTLGGSAGLAVNAKAWLGDVELSKSFTLDALTADWSYGGPWYWPSNCENLPEPTPTPLPGTPTPTPTPTATPTPDGSATPTPTSTPGGPIGTVTPDPSPTPTPPAPSGGGWGDPHMFTFDGLTYDFQGAGEYVLAEGPEFAVHTRFARPSGTNPAVTFNHGVAAKVGGSIIAFGDDDAKTLGSGRSITLDGQAITAPRALPGGASLAANGVVTWPDGTTLEPPRSIGDTVVLRPGTALRGHLRGLLGNADGDRTNDLQARDGTPVTNVGDRAQLYDSFGASWRVSTDSFFSHALGDDIGTPVAPAAPVTLASLPAQARQTAEQQCRAKGLLPGAGLEGCILDVALTGDAGLADHAAGVSGQLEGSVDASALTPASTRRTLQLNTETTGTLSTALAPQVHLVALQAHTPLTLSAAECPQGGSFQIAVTAPDGQPLDRTGGAGCGTLTIADLPQSGVYELRVVDPGGFTGAYRFTASGTPYALGANAHVDLTDGTWTFTTTPGQRVFVDGNATVDGQPTPLTLTTGGPHTLTGSGTLYDVRDRPAINWADLTPLTLAGTAVRVNDFIRLTNNGGNQAGAAWAVTQIDPRGDLHTNFAVNMHDGGGNPADGIAFVLVDPAQPVLGQAGGGLGYTGLAPALAIEFDIYQNGGEPDANQVEILRSGSRLATVNPGFPLHGGGPVYAWVDYSASSLSVFVSQTATKPPLPALTTTVDLRALLGRTARAGFTAATGGSVAQQDLLSWTLANETLPGHAG